MWSLSLQLEINIRAAESSNIEWVKFLRSSQNQISWISVFFLQWHPQDWCYWSVLWFFTLRSLEEVWSSIVHSLSCTNGKLPAILITRRCHGEWRELAPKNQVLHFGLFDELLVDIFSQYLGFLNVFAHSFFTSVIIWSFSIHFAFHVINFFYMIM